jgi:hypothetical protein
MTVVVLVGVALVVAAAVWAARRLPHPEQTASHHDERTDSTSQRFYSDTDRPAGPDAEDPIGPTSRR